MRPVPASFLGAPPGQEESLDRMAGAENYNDWLLARGLPYVGAHVLDFGAGIGTFTEVLASRADVVAVEPDPPFASRLREQFAGRDNVTVIEADASWLDDEALRGRFDTIVCLNVLEHIREHETVLRRFHDCLSPGGHLLLLVPAHQALFGAIDRSVGHERRYSRRLLHGLFGAVGLSPVDIRYVNPVGALGWVVTSRILRREQVPTGPLRAYDALVPFLRRLDSLPLPFGLSVWAVGRRD